MRTFVQNHNHFLEGVVREPCRTLPRPESCRTLPDTAGREVVRQWSGSGPPIAAPGGASQPEETGMKP